MSWRGADGTEERRTRSLCRRRRWPLRRGGRGRPRRDRQASPQLERRSDPIVICVWAPRRCRCPIERGVFESMGGRPIASSPCGTPSSRPTGTSHEQTWEMRHACLSEPRRECCTTPSWAHGEISSPTGVRRLLPCPWCVWCGTGRGRWRSTVPLLTIYLHTYHGAWCFSNKE